MELDTAGIIRTVNEVCCALLQVQKEALIGRSFDEVLAATSENKSERRSFLSALQSGADQTIHYSYRPGGGEPLWLQADFAPFSQKLEGSQRIQVVISDITRQKQDALLLQELKAELQAVRDVQLVAEFDPDGRVRNVNSVFVGLFGYATGEIIGRFHAELVGDEVAHSAEYRAMWDQLRMGKPFVGVVRRIAKSGQELYLQSSYNPITNAEGRVVKVVKFAQDVTRQTALSISLSRAVTEVQAVLTPAMAGDWSHRVREDDKGDDVRVLVVDINRLLSSTESFIADLDTTLAAIGAGRLDARADANRHQGGFRSNVQRMNASLDAVTTPLNVAASYLDRISKGDLPPAISEVYHGDFNAIKGNLNTCIAAVTALVADAGMLSTAAVEGKLATRADASKHQGDFRKIVQGVNETLDAVIGPLNVAASYVDRISKGDIPAPITDSYNGDFNTIKNNLNQAIDAVNKLVADADMLSTAAVQGKLATRADASKHQGDFRKIVQGVNETLDAVIGPLNVAASYVDRISKGDIPAPITDSYNGDFNTIKNNLNQAIDAVNKLVADAGMLSTAAVEGKLATRADATKHQGDFRKIVQGVNETLDAVIGPLGVAADVVDRIARGDIPPPITDSYNGDFNNIKNNLNTCISAVNMLVADAGMLSSAAVEGNLATRADATKHQGDFRKIVQGVNETLDAVIAPINETGRVLSALAQGDLTETIRTNYRGDFDKMVQDTNRTVVQLSQIVSSIQQATASINLAAREIASGNIDLSSRTEQQAASLEETASSMEELTSTVRLNAENAKQANQLALGASDVARKGGMVVGEVVGTMSDIQASSKKIVDIISVIDGIAFQTNILALNAAVEAARAGEQGRGFAVVAAEVRSLAQRSAGAAKEIKTLIGDSVEKVGNGSRLVEQAGRTMEEIVSSVKRVTDIMGEISAASQEQSLGIEQVNKTVTQMDEVTQQNASLVEEASASARMLESQADGLAQAVAKFRLAAADRAVDVSAPPAPSQSPMLARQSSKPRGLPTTRKVAMAPRAASAAAAAAAAPAAVAVAGGAPAEQWAEF
ncbi:MAG: methyl-accepting chemotaxis protein [Nevskia sp.]|nr:methyl-accepting chemotaxis protein [Nevskia sp.]